MSKGKGTISFAVGIAVGMILYKIFLGG